LIGFLLGANDEGFTLDVNGTGRFSGALATNGTRPIVLNASSGNVNIQGETGGWAVQYGFSGNAGTNRGGFGALGGNNDLSYWFIGKAYNDNALSLDFSTGAATFSSSVTAGGNINSRTAVYPQIQFQETTSATNSLIYYDNVSATKLMGFRVNSGSNVMNLTSTNVGIGTASPQAPLHVIAASSADNALIQEWSYTSGTTDQYSLMLKQTVTSGVVRYNFSMVNNNVSYDNVLVLDRGNVGIGTTSPATKVQVDGTGYSLITGSDAGNRRVYIGLDSTGEPSIQGALSNGTARQLTINPTGGNVLIGTTTTPTPVSGVAFPLTVSSSAATRIRIDSTNASPNSGVGLYANGVQKFSFAMYGATSDFTIYNDSLLAPSLTVKGTNSNVLIGTTDDNGSKLRVAGGIGFFDSGIKTGTLDTGYVAGTWKLGRAVIGTQPSETHQIIVEINGALFTIGAAAL